MASMPSFSMDEDYFGPDGFSYRASDGTNRSDPVAVGLEVTELVNLRLVSTGEPGLVGAPGSVTHTVRLENLGPSAATGVVIGLTQVIPAGVTRDSQLASVGAVVSDQWMLDLAEDQTATLQITHQVSPAARGGIDSLSTSATVNRLAQPLTATDDDTTTVHTSVISPADTGVLKLDAKPRIQSQSGLFVQQVTITNNNPLPLAGFRLLITDLPADVQVYNGQGLTPAGAPFIDGTNDLAVGASTTFTIEYFRPNRDPVFDPTFTIEAVFTSDPAESPVAAGGANLDRLVVLDNGDMLLEFSSVPGTSYAIEYSSDLQTWHRVVPFVTATANRTQWIDSGTPKTLSHPSTESARSYRLVTLPGPGK